jgi:hypothetical protein
MVEPQPSKLKTRVRFPSPALFWFLIVQPWALERVAAVAQLVERVLGKDEVTGPNPVSSPIVYFVITRVVFCHVLIALFPLGR